MLYTGRAQGKLVTQDMTSEVLEIYVARPYVPLMKYLFQISATIHDRKLQIVPRDLSLIIRKSMAKSSTSKTTISKTIATLQSLPSHLTPWNIVSLISTAKPGTLSKMLS
jgi:hypothetical protein